MTDAGTSASEVRTAGPPWGEGMDAKCLTTQQRGAVRGRVMRQREYLGKLVERLDALGFPEADPVRVAAVGTRDAVEQILTALDAVEPPAPFLSHYGPSEPIPRAPGVPDAGTAHLPWVGKRRSGLRRR